MISNWGKLMLFEMIIMQILWILRTTDTISGDTLNFLFFCNATIVFAKFFTEQLDSVEKEGLCEMNEEMTDERTK